MARIYRISFVTDINIQFFDLSNRVGDVISSLLTPLQSTQRKIKIIDSNGYTWFLT